MKINAAITNNNYESEIYKFISSINKFDFFLKKIEEINNQINELTLIIANENNNKKQIHILKELLAYESSDFIFFIPSTLKLSNLDNNKIIYFPINIIDFEKEISKRANNISIKFGCFSLNNQNLLIKNNNNHIYLTEPEAHIIKLLFLNKLVKKDLIKKEVLKLNVTVETKSLETHLYRLRKKLSVLSSNISIVSDEKNNLIITKTNLSKD